MFINCDNCSNPSPMNMDCCCVNKPAHLINLSSMSDCSCFMAAFTDAPILWMQFPAD
uniref:Uncharacterized protein n=1 Tax=Human betaherpesvirus 6 TaxID=10368 RepID=A0A1W6G2M9_9BETA|nr:hypothetical protein [Human betaherpesvirus 6]ARM07066.1 hypothetical protein [Human betaherpesvirus 6]ARM08058.1 hypothetical protein [Human betaherpesvirus 6]ARM08664.1 hypothetical protein [Human betaherpesvirus 6]ARM09153.1 hypothetical protein [Human betaherpesvirus 6]